MAVSEDMYGDCQDCPPGYSDLNPKEKIFAGRRTGKNCFAFGDLCDPIEEEVKDLERLLTAFDLYPLIPFFDSGDARLHFFRKLMELSPTHGGCIRSIGDYVLGGQLQAYKTTRPGFYIPGEELEVDRAESLRLVDFIENMNPQTNGLDLWDESKGTFSNYKYSGNGWVKVDFVEVAGKRFAYIMNIDTSYCRYWATAPGEDKIVAISPLWNEEYLRRNPPQFVNLYPVITDYGGGRKSTIIHLKNKVPDREWYGLYDSVNSMNYQYIELQLGQYGREGYASQWIAQFIAEIVGTPEEGDNSRPEYNDGFEEALEQTFTNHANRKRRGVVRRRLPDDTPMEIHEFKANMDHLFHMGMSETSERKIIMSHDWHYLLMGIPSPGRIGASREFKDVFTQKWLTVIEPYQNLIISPYNAAARLVGEWLGNPVMNDVRLGFHNMFAKFLDLEKLASAQGETVASVSTQGNNAKEIEEEEEAALDNLNS